VGDAAFQKKCLGKMGEVAGEGRTVLFVSHNMFAISQLCSQAILLEHGRMTEMGAARRIAHEYLTSRTAVTGHWERTPDEIMSMDGDLQIRMAQVLSHESRATSTVELDQAFQIEIEYSITRPIKECALALQLLDSEGRVILTTWDTDCNESYREERSSGVHNSTCHFPGHLLRPGVYTLTLAAHIPKVKILDFCESVLSFEIVNVGSPMNESRAGAIVPLLRWDLKSAVATSSIEGA
jgi:lipopolysaccharide transport system ATP-binding protein